MALARIDEFITKLKTLTHIKDIKALCNVELDYLRRELGIEPKFSEHGYPIGVFGDARRLKTQVSAYRNAIKALETNSKNSISKIKQGNKIREHKALKYFNLLDYEKQDVNSRDRQRVREDKTNRHSFNPIALIHKSLELLDSESYIGKVAGLYLLTGRRHEEILITVKFNDPLFDTDNDSIIDEWLKYGIESALFSGQVKRKGNDDKPYNIPILASLEKIQNAIEWLRINKPHKPGQRPKGSKELGLKVRKEFQETGLLPIPSGKDTYLNPHNLRSAYCAICWQLYKQSDKGLNCTEDIFVKAIMGHLEESTQSAQSYLDYELSREDFEKLKNLF
jgi:hypothetical protein